MRPIITTCLLALLAVSAAAQTARPTPFDPDSAMHELRIISGAIGPRPMGSPSERRALEHGVARFRSFGLTDAHIMEMTRTTPSPKGTVTNTRSGIAVATLKGTSGRIIVIGAHIDSATPEVPGTNDDGSGTAVVIELARVMSKRPWESTIVFCLFGGEESGLQGSKWFVDHYPLLDSVALMLQVDMANGSDWLAPMYDLRGVQAPQWLASAAFEEFHRLGAKGLRYPTHFYTLNTAFGTGASSDHEPFMDKGIPAIDFTSDPGDPIHTQQDALEWFRPGGLERSGDLVYRLAERFDEGVPPERSGHYLTLQAGGTPIFVPQWVVVVLIVLSIGMGGVTVWNLRPHRTELRSTPRPRIPALKAFAALLLIMLGGWLTEDIVSLTAGWRSSWYDDPLRMLVIGSLGAAVVAVAVYRWMETWNLSKDPYRYFLRTAIWSVILIAVFSISQARLALYPALGLLLYSLAYLVRPRWIRVLLVVAGVYPMVRLVFSEAFEFVARSFAMIPASSLFVDLVISAALTLFTALLAMPAFLTLIAVAPPPSKRTGERTKIPAAFRWMLIVLAWLVLGVIWKAPAYTAYHPRAIRVQQTVEAGSPTAKTEVTGSEYVKNLVVHTVSGDTGTVANITRLVLRDVPTNAGRWVGALDGGWVPSDTGLAIDGVVTVTTAYRPYVLTVSYECPKAAILEASAGTLAVNRTAHTASVRWYSFPDTVQILPLHIAVSEPDTLTETVEATFVQQATPVSIIGGPVNVECRTLVRHERRIPILPNTRR